MSQIAKRLVALLWRSLILLAMPVHGAVVTANYVSATAVPVSAASYTATGNTVNITLGFVPPAGTTLMVVKNTGLAFISGTFGNLAQGQTVTLTYGGVPYPFVANYYGGTGNDLVLSWANTRVLGWGQNWHGELGINSTSDRSIPTLVDPTGVLAGKTIVAIKAGGTHSLALCSDGTLAAWGYNSYGELGNASTIDRSVPVLVTLTGVLAGRTVSTLAPGSLHNLVLCGDGVVASWGYNSTGSLGNNTQTNSNVPVLVDRTGVLAGKTMVAISAGSTHSFALCSDGTLAAWGDNDTGKLGNNSSGLSKVPVLVNTAGLVSGERFMAAAGGYNLSFGLTALPPVPIATNLYNSGSSPKWVMTDDASLTARDAELIFLGDRSVLIQMKSNLYGYTIPNPLKAATQTATRLQSLTDMNSGQDAASALIDYAFGLHPDPNNLGQLPQGKPVGDHYVIEFTQPAGVSGITYGAERSATLLPGSWTGVPDSGSGDQHVFSVPLGTAGKMFMRLKVTGPSE